MWTDPDDRQHPEAAYHGVASVLLAGVLLLMAVPALTLAFLLLATDYPGMGRTDKVMAAYGGYGGAAIVELLCLTALVIGCRGLAAARRTGEPRTLCWVGVLLSLFAIVLWLACVFAWHLQVYQFIR